MELKFTFVMLIKLKDNCKHKNNPAIINIKLKI